MLQIPKALLQERDKRAKWHSIPVLLQELYESSHLNSDLLHTHSVLKVGTLPTMHQQYNIIYAGAF